MKRNVWRKKAKIDQITIRGLFWPNYWIKQSKMLIITLFSVYMQNNIVLFA